MNWKPTVVPQTMKKKEMRESRYRRRSRNRWMRSAILLLCVVGLIGCSLTSLPNQEQTTPEYRSGINQTDIAGQEGTVLSEAIIKAIENTYQFQFENGIVPIDVIESILYLDVSKDAISETDDPELLTEDLRLFSNLIYLSIDGQGITSLDFVTALPQLQYLSALGNPIKDLTPLQALYDLQELYISSDDIILNDENLLIMERFGIPMPVKQKVPILLSVKADAEVAYYDKVTNWHSFTTTKNTVLFELEVADTTRIDVYRMSEGSMDCDPQFFYASIDVKGSVIEFTVDLRDAEYYLIQFCLFNDVYDKPAVEKIAITIDSNRAQPHKPQTTTRRRQAETTAPEPVVSQPELPSEIEEPEEIVIIEEPVIPDIPKTWDDGQKDDRIQPISQKHEPAVKLVISDLGIDQHVFQAKDNSYYLNHDRYGNISKKGELFLDYKYRIGDQVQVIYGHHMHDGSMFASLLNVLKMDETQRSNMKASMIYQHRNDIRATEYELIGAFFYDTRKDSFDYTKTRYEDISELLVFLRKRNVMGNLNFEKNEEDLMLLSTCNYDARGDRFVVVMRKSDDKIIPDIFTKQQIFIR